MQHGIKKIGLGNFRSKLQPAGAIRKIEKEKKEMQHDLYNIIKMSVTKHYLCISLHSKIQFYHGSTLILDSTTMCMMQNVHHNQARYVGNFWNSFRLQNKRSRVEINLQVTGIL